MQTRERLGNVSRRDIVRGTAAWVAAVACGRRLAGGAAPPMVSAPSPAAGAGGGRPFALKYIVASSMYGNLPLANILPEVGRHGAEHIDLWPRPHGTQREQAEEMGDDRLAELLAKHRVKVGMVTRYDLGPMRLAKEWPFVKKFGVRVVVTGSGGPVGLAGAELKAAVKAFSEKLKPHADAAAEVGAVIAIENHGKALIDSSDSLRHFAELDRSPAVGVALAPYHLPQDAELLAGLIRDLGPKLAQLYAWQHGKGSGKLDKADEMLQLPGRGPLDFGPALAALKQIDYAGWTSVFMHPFPRGVPILPTAREVTDAMNAGRDYLERLAAR